MANIWDPSENIVNSFYRGALLKQQAEESERRHLAQIERDKLMQKRIDAQIAQFTENLEERKRVNSSLIAIRDAQQALSDAKEEYQRLQTQYMGSKGLQQGYLQKNAQTGQWEPTEYGAAAMAEADRIATTNVPKLLQAQLISKDKLTNDLALEGARAANQKDLQGARLVSQGIEGNLNRESRERIARMMAGIAIQRLDEARAKQTTKTDEFQTLIDQNREGIKNWERGAFEKLPGGIMGSRMAGAYQQEGLIMPSKEYLDFSEKAGPFYGNFIKDIYEIHQLIKKLPTLTGVDDIKARARIKQLQDNQESNLEQLGKNKGVSGVMTNEDIARQRKNIPEIYPGGFLAGAIAGGDDLNDKRLRGAIDLYKQNINRMFGRMGPEQKALVSNKFGLVNPDDLDAIRPPDPKGSGLPKRKVQPKSQTKELNKDDFYIKR